MTDLTKRLRDCIECDLQDVMLCERCRTFEEGADEIERLERLNAALKEALDLYQNTYVCPTCDAEPHVEPTCPGNRVEALLEEGGVSEKNDLYVGQRVRYIPGHAQGDRNHPDCEDGIVRSFNPQGKPFVVYDNAVRGPMLTLELAKPWTAACTNPGDLVALLEEGE